MLKIGIIGLGDIAGKAYLPVLSGLSGLEIHLCSRNETKLKEVGSRYRFPNLHNSLESLINAGIKGAFVHTATLAHHDIVETLLQNNIHVFVDKPITLEYKSSKFLVELAESKKLILMVGFNRRYAPVYQRLKEVSEPNMIIMQKNRQSSPGELRSFIFDDFIHVVDTLRYLFPYPIDKVLISGKKKDQMLYHVTMQFVSENGSTAIGIMNRDSGTTEEKVEVLSSSEKRVVYNVSELVIQKDSNVNRIGSSDWEPTLHKRGFEQMINDFVKAFQNNTLPMISGRDALRTHEICETIIEALEGKIPTPELNNFSI